MCAVFWLFGTVSSISDGIAIFSSLYIKVKWKCGLFFVAASVKLFLAIILTIVAVVIVAVDQID